MFAEGCAFFTAAALLRHGGSPASIAGPLTHTEFLIAVGFLGVMASVVAYYCQNYYLTYLTVTESAVFTNLVTVFSILAGLLVMHDPFTARTIPAAVMIVGGILGVQLCGKPKQDAVSRERVPALPEQDAS
jgi:drug/metabolite transporter (DMT)-like permease